MARVNGNQVTVSLCWMWIIDSYFLIFRHCPSFSSFNHLTSKTKTIPSPLNTYIFIRGGVDPR